MQKTSNLDGISTLQKFYEPFQIRNLSFQLSYQVFFHLQWVNELQIRNKYQSLFSNTSMQHAHVIVLHRTDEMKSCKGEIMKQDMCGIYLREADAIE